MRAFIFAALIATPLSAQSLDSRYEAIGAFTGMVGDTTLSLTALLDLEKNRSTVRRRDADGFTTMSVGARAIADDGAPTSPSVSFTIGPIGAGATGVRSDIFFSDKTGYYVADVDNGNRASLSDFTQDDISVSFAVDAVLVPVKRGDDGLEIDQDRASQTLSGTFSGTVTDVD